MKIPKHIAIILDGNGRWAKKRKLPRIFGHKKGVERVKEVVREAQDRGVDIVTIFAFSTENWDRPKKEVQFILSQFKNFLDNYRDELMKRGIRLRVIGRRDRIGKPLVERIEETEGITNKNRNFVLNIAFDYGGKWDITNSVKNILDDFCAKKITKEQINEKALSRYLSLYGCLDPDLLIRTSGEERISNFLIWNLAYSEFYFTHTLWPDFGKNHLNKAIEEYSKRKRRFGGLNE